MSTPRHLPAHWSRPLALASLLLVNWAHGALPPKQVQNLREALADVVRVDEENSYPEIKLDRAGHARVKATEAALGRARSLQHGLGARIEYSPHLTNLIPSQSTRPD